MQVSNESALFANLLIRGRISRYDLMESMGLSLPTITKLVKPMLRCGLLVESTERQSPTRGRPIQYLRVNEDRLFAVGIEIRQQPGQTSRYQVVGSLTDLGARVLAREERPLKDIEPARAIHDIASLTADLINREQRYSRGMYGLGIALRGVVDPGTGHVTRYPTLGWNSVPLRMRLARATGLHTVVDTEVGAHSAYERWFGEARDGEPFAVICLDDEINCCIVVKGEATWSQVSWVNEFGHIVVEPGGPPCRCGSRGCLEACASIPAIVAAAQRETGQEIEDFATINNLANDGDERVARLLERSASALAFGLATLMSIVKLKRVIIVSPAVVSISTKYKKRKVVHSNARNVLFSDPFMVAMETSIRQYASRSLRDIAHVAVRRGDGSASRAAAAAVWRDLIAHPMGWIDPGRSIIPWSVT
jgi:predicted NBD/HSP70 family sugar kinase